MEGLVMKKVLGTTFMTMVLLFSTQILSAEASGVETYMNPQSITNNNLSDNDITVSTNVSGTSSFQFNPGNGQGWRDRRANYSYKFSQQWTYNGSPYTYQGQVINQNYGPGPVVSGTATIRYQ